MTKRTSRFSRLLCMLFAFALLLQPLASVRAEHETTLHINSAADLIALSENCVTDTYSTGLTVMLNCDLDLSGSTFSPIPLFAGDFNGCGHEISGLELTGALSTAGLFRRVLEGGTVRNLAVSGTVAPSGSAETVGGIAGENAGTITGCSFTGTVAGSRCAGGIAGKTTATALITGCTVSGSVSAEHSAGGIAGENSGVLRKCSNYADVNTKDPGDTSSGSSLFSAVGGTITIGVASLEEIVDVTDIGGIAGYSEGSVEACTNSGAVGYRHVGYNVGGIIGRQTGSASGCLNIGTVLGRRDVGGITGQLDPDAVWSTTETAIGELRGELDSLQSDINRLLENADRYTNNVGSAANQMESALSEAAAAAETLSADTETWLNSNMDAASALLSQIKTAVDGFAPVADALADLTEALPAISKPLANACNALSDAAEDAGPALKSLAYTLDDMEDTIIACRSAVSSIRTGLDDLNAAAGDPEQIASAIRKIATGFVDLTTAANVIAAALRSVAEANPGAAPSALLSEMAAALSGMTAELSTAAAALQEIAAGCFTLVNNVDTTKLASALDQLQRAVASIDNSLKDYRYSSDNFHETLIGFSNASEDGAAALDNLSTAFRALDPALDALDSALTQTGDTLSALSKADSIRFTKSDAEEDRQAMFDSLGKMNTALSGLTESTTDTAVLADLKTAANRLFTVSDLLMDLLSGDYFSAGGEDYVKDISDSEAEHTRGILEGCINRGSVDAMNNAGGITGACSIDLNFDYENNLNLSGLISGGAKYVVFARIADCENAGAVSASQEAAGGIVGRADYGTVRNCSSSGNVNAGGAYAGGIAGLSLAAVSGCTARAEIRGERYVGGIVGSGNNILSCFAMPVFDGSCEFHGAIAGYATGTVSGNLYSGTDVGGVDGFSISGCADRVSREELSERADDSDLFSTVTVTFVCEDLPDVVMELPFGGRVDTIPAVPDKDGKRWKWDDFDNSAVYCSMTVSGSYQEPRTVLSFGGEPADYLAEGIFFDADQTLSAVPFTPAEGSFPPEVLLAATLSVTDYDAPLTVHARVPEDGTLWVAAPGEGFMQASCERDGSYLVFELPNNGSFVITKAERHLSGWAIAGIGLGGAAVIGTGIGLLCRKSRRKQA